MRAPVAYTASEIVNWHIAEEFEPGRWRPSRCCGFSGLRHWKMRMRLTWSVFTGKNDVLVWGALSGHNGTIQRDCTEPGFLNAAKVVDRIPSNLGCALISPTDDDFRPSKFHLSNAEVRSTGILCGGAVQNIALELLQLRTQVHLPPPPATGLKEEKES